MDTRVEVPQYEMHEEVEVDPATTALIVVDMQNDFVKEGGALVVPDAEATIPAIQGLLNLARESAMKIVFTQDTHNEGARSGRSGRSTSAKIAGMADSGRAAAAGGRARRP